MAGPHPPNDTVGSSGPQNRGETPPLEYPHDPGAPPFNRAGGDAGPPPANYPGPPPAPYPARRSKRRLFIGIALVLAVATALTVAIVYGVRTNGAGTGGAFSEGATKSAIQGYLTALERRDIDEIVRNALCGMYDGVRDKRSDQALARLSSDAFRKQFSEVDVTSIDKIVYLSQYQAQALFSMRVTPATGGPTRDQVQGIAQMLFQRGQITVCSYVLRTGGTY
ncbi:Rv0361 family membrane protein [Mycobacterium sp. 050134]|uniref:Rv0361 family membrane protein n=1 Tax=Mycobacterium sp. 050134 TaxID=3096111 RepID=UPI002ED886EF